jgi:MFS family permease
VAESSGVTAQRHVRVVVSPRTRRARIGASAVFAVQGLCFASVIARVPVMQSKFGLTDLQLTTVLGAVPIVAGVGSVLAGVLAPRVGSGTVLRFASVGVATAAAADGLVSTRVQLYVAVAALGLFLGAVDATMNMQGVAVQRRYGRSILASCHAFWSIAAIAGSAAAILTANLVLRLSLSGFLAGVGVVGVLIALTAGPHLLKRTEEAENPATAAVETAADTAGPAGVKVGRTVALIGIALMVMFIGDAAATSWGPVYLQNALHATSNQVPAGLFAYLIFQFLGRSMADRIIGRLGAVGTAIGGCLIAAAGFAVVALAPNVVGVVTGFALVGAGLSVVVPLTFSAADALDPAGTGKVIASVNLFNYAGVVVGSILIGVIADASGYRVAFGVPGVLVLLILVLAPSFRVVDLARARAARAMAAR